MKGLNFLKPISEIENMPDECEEIQSGGLLKRYVERPARLQKVTLAEWTAWYDSCGKQSYTRKSTKLDIDQLPQETGADDENDDEQRCDEHFTVQQKIKLKRGHMPGLLEVSGLISNHNQRNTIEN